MVDLLIDGMQGLGDNLYQRAVLRQLATGRKVYLRTPWPQLYAGTEVHPVRPEVCKLRTQNRNMATPGSVWEPAPVRAQVIRLHYSGTTGSMLASLCDGVKIRPAHLNMSGPPLAPRAEEAPYIVVRPATIRSEWRADARNPKPEYIAQAAAMMRQRGYRVISVADLKPAEEWALEPLPVADETHHAGELGILDLLSLVKGAAGIIGGVGWAVPAAMAYNVPMLLIYGGCGAHNGPSRIFDSRVDSSRFTQIMPDNFCQCASARHDCNKEVSDYARKIESWIV